MKECMHGILNVLAGYGLFHLIYDIYKTIKFRRN